MSAADLSYKRTAQAVSGDGGTAIDVDEFVSKCISFMRQGEVDGSTQLSSSQRRRRRASGRYNDAAGDGEDEDDEEDILNWDWLGRKACFHNNLRPAVSGFLLGPLSVQKKVRQTQRRARQERMDPSQVARPQDLNNEDLESQKTSFNLTSICTEIKETLGIILERSEQLVERELSQMDEVTDEIAADVMDKYCISDNGGVPLFRFCINPRSFGQTVENLFYISFLIRDGSVGVALDSNDLPTLRKCILLPVYF